MTPSPTSGMRTATRSKTATWSEKGRTISSFPHRPNFCRTGVQDAVLIASRVHPTTGLYTGENCFGPEKVFRLMEQCPGCTFEEFYSDSLSDTPLADLAERAYLVTGTACRLWPR